jgi:two-component system, chemotaxis family, protein-glutamate methylesterase/glutaminase
MFALPPQLRPGSGNEVSGVTCPTCHGSLEVRAEGRGYLHFTCRIGHAFSLREMLEAHERFLEDTMWSAVRAAEELQQILHDVIQYRRRLPADVPEADYEARRQRAAAQAAAVRGVLERDEPITFDPTPEQRSEGE